MSSKVLSVIVPCYNEKDTIISLLNEVLKQPQVGEVIVIDDKSTDNSSNQIHSINDPRIRFIQNTVNKGKGFCVALGFNHATMPYVLIQDADLEYSPEEYGMLLAPLLADKADVVFGSRFLSSSSRRVLYYWHRLGNNFLTTLSNIFTNIDLTDMETCYKVMKNQIAKSLDIHERRFGIEPEITAKVAALKVRIFEVPISYNGRTYEEGKKITWRDGFSAIRCIVKYNQRSQKHNQLLRYKEICGS
jgi:glycosyltransferase involved in cell wall biosynthesis